MCAKHVWPLYSLNTFTEHIPQSSSTCNWKYQEKDVKRLSSWTMEKVHKKVTWHNEVHTSKVNVNNNANNNEINFDVTYDGHQNAQNVHKIYKYFFNQFW